MEANIMMHLNNLRKYCQSFHLDDECLRNLRLKNSLTEQLIYLIDYYAPPKLENENHQSLLSLSYHDLMLPYLISILDGINQTTSKDLHATLINYTAKNSGTRELKMELLCSPYGSLILSSKNSCFDSELTSSDELRESFDSSEDSTDDLEESLDEPKYSPSFLHTLLPFKQVFKLYCPSTTESLAEAILNNIQNSPDIISFIRYLRVDKTENPKSFYDTFEQYKTKNGEIGLSMEEIKTNPAYKNDFIQIFKPEMQELLLILGGPIAIEFFRHQFDPTYKNWNLNKGSYQPNDKIHKYSKNDAPIQNSCNFYEKTYKAYLKNSLPELWNCFLIETVLNGATLFAFSSLLSGKGRTHLTDHLTYDQANKIYRSLQCINNPFLKYEIITTIVHKTYFKDYNYEENSEHAGKNNIEEWLNFIKNYCYKLSELERKIYPSLISFQMKRGTPIHIPNDERQNSITCYLTLFKNSSIYPYGRKKSQYFYPLLRIALLNNKLYYNCIFSNLYPREE